MHVVMLQDGRTALMKASWNDNVEIVKLLLQHNADLKLKITVRNIW